MNAALEICHDVYRAERHIQVFLRNVIQITLPCKVYVTIRINPIYTYLAILIENSAHEVANLKW